MVKAGAALKRGGCAGVGWTDGCRWFFGLCSCGCGVRKPACGDVLWRRGSG